MNSWLWHRDLRKHYMAGRHTNPLASLTDFKMLEKGGVKVLWSSLHIPESNYFRCWFLNLLARVLPSGRKLLKRTAWECLLDMMGNIERQVARAGDRFEVVRSNAELDRALAAGKTAFVHTVEGGHVLSDGLEDDDVGGRLARLDQLAERGVASLTIAHLFRNDLAGHANAIPKAMLTIPTCPLDPEVEPARALTNAGEAVVERMAKLGIVPDVTHCTPAARQRVYELAGRDVPVIASHNGVQSLNPEPYNLTEADVHAIRDSGGVVGVIFMPYWLEESHPKPGLDAIWRTMETVREWSGSWEHVAIGTDFDGFTDPPDDCKSAGELPRVREMLEKKGLAPGEVEAVLGGNARRVLQSAWR